jgi:hypothetical protein
VIFIIQGNWISGKRSSVGSSPCRESWNRGERPMLFMLLGHCLSQDGVAQGCDNGGR